MLGVRLRRQKIIYYILGAWTFSGVMSLDQINKKASYYPLLPFSAKVSLYPYSHFPCCQFSTSQHSYFSSHSVHSPSCDTTSPDTKFPSLLLEDG